jgi:predicted lipoprotein with Yx(FWY)xxD motif
VKLTTGGELGTYLVDGDGRTLYLYTRDELGKSNCSGNCAQAWPPLIASTVPAAGEGLAATAFNTITRDDGAKQVTYNGWPLYYYARDAKAGDVTGQNVGNVWFVLSPNGGPIQTAAEIKAAPVGTLGTVLVDRSGRVLYMFTRDEPNKSNCSGNCAIAWPALYTVGAPTAGEGANASLFGVIDRPGGLKQVTYNGMPLYYYNKDVKPGDSVGQNVGGVWFVVTADGKPVGAPPATTAAQTPTPTTAATLAEGY